MQRLQRPRMQCTPRLPRQRANKPQTNTARSEPNAMTEQPKQLPFVCRFCDYQDNCNKFVNPKCAKAVAAVNKAMRKWKVNPQALTQQRPEVCICCKLSKWCAKTPNPQCKKALAFVKNALGEK